MLPIGGAPHRTTIGRLVVGGTANQILYLDSSGKLAGSANLTFGPTAGQGIALTAGTAVTNVAALSITRTNNHADVIKGVEIVYTDTTSNAGFLPVSVLGGSAGTTNLFSVPKEGGFSVAAKVMSGTAPTLASGGCTNAAMVNNNGTARFEADVGTSCSGSQPLVFTLPAATTGWNCTAQNVTNPATSVAAQTSAVSTTSVTITSFSRTLGTAAAWADGDNVVVSCLGG